MAPVALRVEIAEIELVLIAELDRGDGARDLAGDEGLAAKRAFVVEQNAVRGVHAVGLAVVHHDPIGVELGGGVGTARIERRLLALRNLGRLAVELRRRRLIEAGLLGEPEQADRLQQPQRSERIGIGGVFGGLEAHLHVALRGEIVDLVGLRFLHDADQVGRIGHVAIVQDKLLVRLVRVLIEMLDAAGVERRRAPLDAVDGVALVEQQFGKIRPVLPGDAGDEGHLADSRLIHELPR